MSLLMFSCVWELKINEHDDNDDDDDDDDDVDDDAHVLSLTQMTRVNLRRRSAK